MKPTIKISARKSDLARLQAYTVGDAIKKQFKFVQIDYLFRESLGDKNLENPLWKMPEKGVFTQDFKSDLIDGRTDMVVHSWKDLPIEEPGATMIAGTLDRADERDVLLLKKQYAFGCDSALKIFSSSPRREFNLKPFFEWSLPYTPKAVSFTPVRGNIQTRVQKTLEASDVHGIIVAKAALDRLLTVKRKEFAQTQTFLRKALKSFVVQVIPLSQSPTSAAQGALAVEISGKNSAIKKILKTISNPADLQLVNLERQLFKRWGGGCHQKMGLSLKFQGKNILKFEKGLDQFGQFIWTQEILESEFAQMNKPIKAQDLGEFHTLLEKNVTGLKVHTPKKNDALIVTKGNLLKPNGVKPQLIWTSGVETWKQLAQQGYFVSGSYDSHGESLAPEIDVLFGTKPKWKKLTHNKGHSKKWAKTVKLYQVDYSGFGQLGALKNKTHFYWSHGDLFLTSLKRFPWLKNKKHICGLGATLDVLVKHVKPKNIIPVYNYKEWKKKWIN